MKEIKAIPSRVYWALSTLIEMIILFFMTIGGFGKPSDSLTREDIDNIRHKRKFDHNGNDYKYKGKRDSSRFYMGG